MCNESLLVSKHVKGVTTVQTQNLAKSRVFSYFIVKVRLQLEEVASNHREKEIKKVPSQG